MFGQGNFGSSFEQGPNKLAQPFQHFHPTIPHPPHFPILSHPSSLQQSYPSPHPPPIGQFPVIPSVVLPGPAPLQFPPAHPPHLLQSSHNPSLQGSTFRAVQTDQYPPPHLPIPNVFHIPPPPTHPQSMVPSRLPNHSEPVRAPQLSRFVPPPLCQRPPPYAVPNPSSSTVFFPQSQHTLLPAPLSFSDFSFSSLGSVSHSGSESPPPPPPPSSPPPEPPSPPPSSPPNLSPTTEMMAISNEHIDHGLHSEKRLVSEQLDYNSLHPVVESENQCAVGSTLEDLSSSDSIDFDVPSPPQKPTCQKLIQRIDDMCQAIVNNGPDFEEITLREVSGNPEFNFMFPSEPGSEEAMVHDYYLWVKRKCFFELKYPQDHEISDNFSPPPEETEISTHETNMNDMEITHHGDSDMDMEDDIVSFEKIVDISTTPMKENPDTVLVHNDVDLYEPLHPESDFASHEEADNLSSDSSSLSRPTLFAENPKDNFLHGGVFAIGKPVSVGRDEEPGSETQADQIIDGLEPYNFACPSIERSSPFRLLQDYASDDSCGYHEDIPTEGDKSLIVVHLNKTDKPISPHRDVGRNVDSDIESKSPHGTETETPLLQDSNKIPQEITMMLSEAHKYVEGAVSMSVENRTNDIMENHETQKSIEDVDDGGDSHTNIAVEDGVKNNTEDDKNVSTSLKVDEFGRLVREGVSESDSDDSYYIRKRVSRGRSWSRSRSPRGGNGRRKRVTSPRKRRDRSRSRSLSSKRRREMSGSPPMNKKFYGDDEYRHNRSHVPDCLDFLRGRCYRGGSCRYIHHTAAMGDARPSFTTNEMYVEGPHDSEKLDIFPSHGSYGHRKNDDRNDCREGRNAQLYEEISTSHGFPEEKEPEENNAELDNFVQSNQPLTSVDPHFCNRTEEVAEALDGEETQKQPDSFYDLSKSGGHSSKTEILSEAHTTADIVAVNAEIGSVDGCYQNPTIIFKAAVIPYQECSPEPESPEVSEHDSDKVYEPTVLASSITQTEHLPVHENIENEPKNDDESSLQVSLLDQSAEFLSHEPSQITISSSPFISGVVTLPLPPEITPNLATERECSPVSASATELIHVTTQLPSKAPLPHPYSRQQDPLSLQEPLKTVGCITSSSRLADTFHVVSSQNFSSPKVPFSIQESHLSFSSAPSPQIPMALPPPPPLLPPRPPLLLPPPPLLPYGGVPNTVVPSSHAFRQNHEFPNNNFISNPWTPLPGKLTSISTPSDFRPLSRPMVQNDSWVPFHLGDNNVKNMQFGNQLSIPSEGPCHPREEFLHFPRPSSTPSFYVDEGSHQHASFSGDSFGSSIMQKYPPNMDRNEVQYSNLMVSRFASRHNPYASTFEQPLNIKFNTIPSRQGNELHHNKFSISSGLGASVDVGAVSCYGSRMIGSSLNSSAVGQVLPDSVGHQYDQSSSLYGKSDSIPMKESEDEINKIFRSENSQIPSILEDENNTKYAQPVVPPTVTGNSENGEKEDLEVGIVDDESLSNLNELAKAVIGDIEIDQDIYQGKKKKSKDSKSMKLFKVSLADFVKEILKPSWRQGNMSKEAFKTIVKKTVDKVSGAMKGHHIPRSQAKINQYIDSSQRKLTKLVMGYVDKYVKL